MTDIDRDCDAAMESLAKTRKLWADICISILLPKDKHLLDMARCVKASDNGEECNVQSVLEA